MSKLRNIPTDFAIKMAVAILLSDALRNYPDSRSLAQTREWRDVANWLEDAVIGASSVVPSLPRPTTLFSLSEEVDKYAVERFAQLKERELQLDEREREMKERNVRIHEMLKTLSEQLASAALRVV